MCSNLPLIPRRLVKLLSLVHVCFVLHSANRQVNFETYFEHSVFFILVVDLIAKVSKHVKLWHVTHLRLA